MRTVIMHGGWMLGWIQVAMIAVVIVNIVNNIVQNYSQGICLKIIIIGVSKEEF